MSAAVTLTCTLKAFFLQRLPAKQYCPLPPFFSPCCQPRRSFSSKLSHLECPNPNRTLCIQICTVHSFSLYFLFPFLFLSRFFICIFLFIRCFPLQNLPSLLLLLLLSLPLRAVWQSGNRHADSQQNMKN